MEDLSLHLLDLVENSLNAGANLVEIDIDEQPLADRMTVTINDNGKGMDAQTLARASDPFFTTRTTRRIGLGLSLIKANAEAWGGGMELSSAPGVGTRLHFWFQLGHIDRQPLGDWPGTLLGLIMSRPGVEFVYRHRVGENDFEMDTRELRRELGPEALQSPAVVNLLRPQVRGALDELGSTA
ncbi:histidine kinase [Desulfarculus baarsii DSM 2075]|uniref:histidine kinase n=1 Tax=Desulfarculus baarsii (strain ATCC 33931 / DSM 2075 / LMG 7858 / VKM B-1802 / 2st14) TaxID=644282 RepID=E1QH46_DESB2|nr:ATP-binding protein [Desulfarculus baarsii]ADK84889.1 histidine kinase [Desulfarculus baarsii DSM 2075]